MKREGSPEHKRTDQAIEVDHQPAMRKPPQIQVVRVKRIDPAVPELRFQLSDDSVDLMKAFSLGGFEGIGGAWKMPPPDESFDARFGRW